MLLLDKVKAVFSRPPKKETMTTEATLTTPEQAPQPTAIYASMTDSQKVVELEKAVSQQGEYLKAFKETMKILNRRNTLAIIEMQMLIRDAEIKHPDLQEIISPTMAKVAVMLDFKKPYDC
jgi:hypothetical protein